MATMAENNKEKCISRFGYVSDYDATRHMARIQFPDKNNLVSGWLPVMVRNSHNNHDENHLDIGEHVFCILMGNGCEEGCVIGSIYDDSNRTIIHDKDVRAITFEDGTEIKYDRKKNLLEINCVGEIKIHADKHIELTSERIDLN